MDAVILDAGAELFRLWAEFEVNVFGALMADPAQHFGTLLNVGAGRQIAEPERPFVNRFAEVHLVEPDPERRQALAASLDDDRFTVHAEPLEALPEAGVPPADFVLCKYVLQHLPTYALGDAAERLAEAVAPDGMIGIFTTYSPGDDQFQIAFPPDWHEAVADLLGRRLSDTFITEDEFNRLSSEPQDIPLIVTHHISPPTWARFYRGWRLQQRFSAADTMFVGARPRK